MGYEDHMHLCELAWISSNWRKNCPHYKRKVGWKGFEKYGKHYFQCGLEDVCDRCKHMRYVILHDTELHILGVI